MLAPIPARTLKAMLDGNWTMDRGPDDEILSIPKHGKVLAIEVMYSLLAKAKIDDRKLSIQPETLPSAGPTARPVRSLARFVRRRP